MNPTLLTLARQRGGIDCGGLDDLVVAYGSFFQQGDLPAPMLGGDLAETARKGTSTSRRLPVRCSGIGVSCESARPDRWATRSVRWRQIRVRRRLPSRVQHLALERVAVDRERGDERLLQRAEFELGSSFCG